MPELQQWTRAHDLAFPVLVDGQGAELGRYYPLDSVPVSIAVDPRTMAVLSMNVGGLGGVERYYQGGLGRALIDRVCRLLPGRT